ncbi:flagellar basal-body MS-ring/collar protein FliF [Melioribacteraceae bacterium 4301-Me]|uniref:flagellar basal-body MS-ring/collar protein FliF n=1 Tax=Pyranulibacter aquaticus TaxID=3163344 RepID=UPI0035990DA7
MNKNPFSELLQLFNKLAPQQKILIGGAAIVVIVLFGVFISIINEPNYATLYSNISEEDASKVVDYLNSQKIAFKLESGGRTIKVPQEVVYEVRLALASKGIPSSGVIGYEIFDKNTMGMSEFMQKLNFKRALEGELSRTIMQQEGVLGARVMIVMPEKSIFKDEEKSPSASVVLKLKPGYSLSPTNITAIVNLVASSVEGLTQSKVTIIDTQGHLLSKNNDDNSLIAATSTQYELKQSVEKYLSQKAQKILDNVLGYGNSAVQVSVDLNFDQVEKTMEQYDPDSQVAISEQTIKSENNGKKLNDSTANVSQNTITNYEINKSIQKVIEGTGNIKRISIAAVVNDIPQEIEKNGKKEITYQQRTQEQLNKFGLIIKNALGFDESRGDSFSIVSFPFEQNNMNAFNLPQIEKNNTFIPEDVDKWINLVLIIVAIGASLFIIKKLMQRLKTERILLTPIKGEQMSDIIALQPAPENEPNLNQQAVKKKKLPIHIGDIEDEISDEALRKKTQQEKIANYVSKNPMDAAKLINSWLHEDE